MTEQSIADFLAELDARAAERDEEERALLTPPRQLGAIGKTVVAGVAAGLRQQIQNAPTTRLTDTTSSERPKFCRHCGAALKPEGRFCTKCGEPIEA
ncbi:MAG: zinc ribbon domain-containing protein [Anaerolineae bacterium]|nr:zinc ribbon domain-containing protein [Anaerolineae bacterium]